MEKLTYEPISTKKCDFCHAGEGKKRPIGNFIVKLRTVTVHGEQKYACQSCAHKHWSVLNARKESHEKARVHFHSGLQQVKKFAEMILHLAILLALFSQTVQAQPALPGAPDQAPIDGGLSLLAAAERQNKFNSNSYALSPIPLYHKQTAMKDRAPLLLS